jgi:hypothetical protein
VRINARRIAASASAVFAIQQAKAILARSCEASRLFEIACVLVRLDHVASGVVNPNHSII